MKGVDNLGALALAKLRRFFLAPAYANPLAVLRIGLTLFLLLQSLILHSEIMNLFGASGLAEYARIFDRLKPDVPSLPWLIHFLARYGVSEVQTIYGIGWIYLLSLFFLGLGWRTHRAALVAWLCHWMFMNTSPPATYGVDVYAHIFIFYLILVPSGKALSLDAFLRQRPSLPDPMVRLGLRVMQIHLCIIYLANGIAKIQNPNWWNGEILWQFLNTPIFIHANLQWLAHWPILLTVLAWLTLLLEIGYCVFIWPKFSRATWVPAIVGMHIGIGLFLGLYLFSVLMCLLTISLFTISPDTDLGLGLDLLKTKLFPTRTNEIGQA